MLKISSKYSRVIFTGLRTRSHQTCFKHMIVSTNRSKPFVLVSAHISRKTAVTPREDSFIELVKNDKYAYNHQLCFHRLRYNQRLYVLFVNRKNSGNILYTDLKSLIIVFLEVHYFLLKIKLSNKHVLRIF